MKRWYFNCNAFLVMMVFVQSSLMIPHGVSASSASTDDIVAIPTRDLVTREDALGDYQFQHKINLQGNNGNIMEKQRGNKSNFRLPAARQLFSDLLLLTTGGNNRALNEIDGSIISSSSAGDFDELNEILAEAEIILPELSFEAGTFLRNELILTVSQTVCSGLSVEDIIIRHANVGTNNTDILFTIELQNFAFDCDIDWSSDWIFDSSGDGQVFSSGNNASVGITFTSTDFRSKPPTSAELSSCGANMQIDGIDLQGGLDTQIINEIEEPLRSPIEDALEELICDEADAISDALNSLITILDEFIEPHPIGIPHKLIDPLYPEQNSLDMDLVLESGVELLAYRDSRLYQMILPFIDNMLGGPVDDPNSPTGTGMDLGANIIIRAAILNDDRALVIGSDSLPNNEILIDNENELSRSTVIIKKIALKGLDTMTNFDPLNVYPNGEYTLSNSFGFKSIDIEVDLAIEMRSANSDGSSVGDNETVVEQMSMDIGLDDLDVDFAFLLAIDNNKIAHTPLGAIMTDFGSLISCAIRNVVHSAEVSFLSVTVGNLKSPKFDDLVSTGLDRVVAPGIDALFAMYEGVLLDLMPSIFQVNFRNMINEMLMKALQDSQDCTFGTKEEGVASRYVNFPDLFLNAEKAVSVGGLGKEQYGILMENLRSIIESDAMESAGASFLNEIIVRPLTSGQSGSDGSIIFNYPLLDIGGDVEIGKLEAKYSIKIPNLSIENLDTISSPLALLIPSSPQALNNFFTLGAGVKPIILKTGVLFAFDNGVDKIENELDIELEMFSTRVEINAVIKIFEELMLGFPLEDVGIIDCWLSKIPSPLLDEFGLRSSDSSRSMFFDNLGLSASKVRLNIRCIKCTSPEFDDLAKGLSSMKGMDDLTKAMNDTFDWIANILGENFTQIQIDRLLANSQMKCPHSSSYTPTYQAPDYDTIQYSTIPETQGNVLIQFVATIASLTVLIIVITNVIRRSTKIKFGSWARSLSPEKRFAILEKTRREKSWQMKMDRKTRSIFRSSLVPVTVRFLIPLVIIGNILLFLSGHLSLGAGVNVNIELAGQSVPLGIVFEFSLGRSIVDMWESGAKEVAVILAIFSGVWPYTKQLVTFFLWFCPTQFVSVSRRGSTLQWLDILGKWSFVDIFVLVITLAAFRIKVRSPDDFAFLPLNFYSLDLLVIPSWGLYANMIAQVLSQVSSHVVIHYHRKIVNDELNEENAYLDELPSGKRLALCENIFDRDGAKEEKGLVVKHGVTIYVMTLSLAICTLLCCGCAFDTIQFETFGLLGVFIEAGQDFEDASTYYGVFTMLKVMIEQAGYTGVTSDYIGLGFLAFLFVSTVLLVPLALILLLLVRWFRPLNRKERSKFSVAIETLSAWQYSEVFILSVIITSWQLAPVSEFFINDNCEGLKNMFDALVLYGVIENTDAQCFRVEPSIKFATWLLTAGAMGLAVLNHFISTAAMHQNSDEVSIYRDNFIIPPNDATTTKLDDQNDKGDYASVDDIRTPPLRFTDYYRWLLQPEKNSAMSVTNEAKLRIQPDTTNNSSDIEDLDLALPVPSQHVRKESKQAEKLTKSDQWETFHEA